jgi:hypothetical protein
MRTLSCRISAFVKAASRGNIEFAADNRLNAVFLRVLIEVDSAEDITVISHGDSGHLILFRPFEKIIETDSPVKQAILCMYVKMNKLGGVH